MLDTEAATLERHKRFIERVTTAGEVWGLKGAKGFCFAESNNTEKDVLLFWSDRALAKQCAKEDWAACEPTSIPLPAFLERWLPGMAHDGALAGTNWNAHLVGVELEPATLKQELEAALGTKRV